MTIQFHGPRSEPLTSQRWIDAFGLALQRSLAHQATLGLSPDDPRTTQLRRRLVQENEFLKRVYLEWYADLSSSLPPGEEPVLEIGSGAGFMNDCMPRVLNTDVFYCPGMKAVLDGQALPFQSGSLRAIVMTDVLHHLPDVRRFFHEATRVLRPGGVISMVEPWVTNWSRIIYGRFHHEPFSPEAADWELTSGGPLSGANGALPWIVFARDRSAFEREFPALCVQAVSLGMPLRYALSGGVTMRGVMPAWTFDIWRAVENVLQPLMEYLAMFAHITLVRRQVTN
jgi:SAM-dependent methyltransferase